MLDRAARCFGKRQAAIDRLAKEVQHSAERRPPHRHLNAAAGRAQPGVERHRLTGGQQEPTRQPPAGQRRDLDPQVGIVEAHKQIPRLGSAAFDA